MSEAGPRNKCLKMLHVEAEQRNKKIFVMIVVLEKVIKDKQRPGLTGVRPRSHMFMLN